MINKQELSKFKYLYRIYSSGDKVMHCEKYPIIYSNGEIVYFKTGRKRELSYIYFKNIKDEYTCIESRDLNYFGYYSDFDKYYFKVENFDSKKATEDAFKQKKKSELDSAKLAFERAEREYLQKKEKYDKLTTKY
jgi:hydroxymethylpyrimidine pyrophosphatase-like HAD family hydrolase